MMPAVAYILFSSGTNAVTMSALRARWDVLDIPLHRDAVHHVLHCDELPLAVVIGHAVRPPPADGSAYALPDLDGDDIPAHQILAELLAIEADLPVVVSTRLTESNAIVYLIKRGAFDYVVEPRDRSDAVAVQAYTDHLLVALERAVKWRELLLENRSLRLSVGEQPTAQILGRSPGVRRVIGLIQKVAPTPTTVLLTGESGTGKELAARAIHEASGRSGQPFLGINCGSLEDTLLRSELFGHEKGAFTGAQTRRAGLIREAGQGTLFLDEISTVTPAFQVALLRALEERVARPVGGGVEYRVECRFIAASNRDLAAMVETGQFRKDLYYRLNVFEISIPPLRDRIVDVPLLAQHFVDRIKADYGKPEVRFSPAAMEALERYDWPGNVRELRNGIERSLILCDGSEIRPADLALPAAGGSLTGAGTLTAGASLDLEEAVRRLEAQLIRSALARAGDNVARAARLLGLKRPTLHYRMKQLGIAKEKIDDAT